jgi:hypothetical protein
VSIEFSRGENHCCPCGRAIADLAENRREFPGVRAGIRRPTTRRSSRSRSARRGRTPGEAALERALRGQVRDWEGPGQITSSTELGEARNIPVDYASAGMQICFNADYVDNFRVVESEAVLEFKERCGRRDEAGWRRRVTTPT